MRRRGRLKKKSEILSIHPLPSQRRKKSRYETGR
ncbi:hypothetical protein V6Z11_A03G124000 [Gossypium hirsutum]